MSSVQLGFNYLLGAMCSVFSLVVILWYQGLGTIFQKIDPPEATCTTTPKLVFLGVPFSKNRPARGNLYNDAKTCVVEGSLFRKMDPPEATCTTTPRLVFSEVHFSKNRPAGGNLYNAARACVEKVPILKK